MAKAHVLIIDDDVNNLGILAEMLNQEGIEHTTIEDPRQIETVFKQLRQIDAIFLDLEMPGLNGYDVFDRIRKNERLKSVPVIAHTVHTSEFHNVREMGFNGFISKPLDVDQFPDQLARILRGETVWAPI